MEVVHAARRSEHSASPLSLLASIRQHRDLILSLTARDLQERFKGSLLGSLWFVLLPATLIVVYTIVFGVVFKAPMPFRRGAQTSQLEFGLFLFAGLTMFTVFSDVVSRSLSVIVSRPHFVKRVLFPLEVLAVVTVLSALAGGLLSFLLLLVAMWAIQGTVPALSVMYPIYMLLMLPMLLGLSWFLASVGAYIRDVVQIIGLVLTVALFLGPVFSPLSAFPKGLQPWLVLNPITKPIEFAHLTLFQSQLPEPAAVVAYFGVGLVVMWLGWAFFQTTRAGFADVL
jgi:lipopolysaccharide transport system permease protein